MLLAAPHIVSASLFVFTSPDARFLMPEDSKKPGPPCGSPGPTSLKSRDESDQSWSALGLYAATTVAWMLLGVRSSWLYSIA